MSSPLHKRKAPPLKTFWWRFCVYDFETSYGSGSWLQF